jgi:serine protease Do
MEEPKPTLRQLVIFTVVMSFIVSVIGTVLTIGVMAPLSAKEGESQPFIFSRPKILERITEKVIESEKSERILRQDELVVQVVGEASPAVVSIVASKDVPVVEQFFLDPFGEDPFFQRFFGDEGFRIPQFRQKGTEKKEVSSGTGFFVSKNGMILTNKHVVADAEAEYTIFMNDGRKMKAAVLARDPLQDLAILKVQGKDFPSLRFGNSASVKIGQTVIAIGNALGEFRNTVSVGVVSGLHRSLIAGGGASGPETLQELIQTDAAINPGNSGGPLLNLSGEVVGINTAMARGAENIGFAIPVDSAKRAAESVEATGKILYPFLGVRYIVITKEIAEKMTLGRDYGVLLESSEQAPAVIPGSPAEKAGLKAKDILLELNGEKITTEKTLASLIQARRIGDEVTLKVFREGREFEVKAKLEERK